MEGSVYFSQKNDTSMCQPKESTLLSTQDCAPPRIAVVKCRWSDCSAELATMQLLAEHLSMVHIGCRKALYPCKWYGCPRGGRPFTKRHKLLNHLRTHTGERPFLCTIEGCPKSFSRSDSLASHVRTHAGVGPCICPVPGCGRCYLQPRSLRKHIAAHQWDPTAATFSRGVDATTEGSSAENGDSEDEAAVKPFASIQPRPKQPADSVFRLTPYRFQNHRFAYPYSATLPHATSSSARGFLLTPLTNAAFSGRASPALSEPDFPAPWETKQVGGGGGHFSFQTPITPVFACPPEMVQSGAHGSGTRLTLPPLSELVNTLGIAEPTSRVSSQRRKHAEMDRMYE